MPLDTQPLSPTRRILMLAVLLSFLAGSLAFAQYLVLHRQTKPFLTTNFAALGFTAQTAPMLHDEAEAQVGVVGGRPRRLDFLTWEVDEGTNLDEQAGLAADLFLELMNTVPQETTTADLAHLPGVQASGTGANGRIAMVRLAVAGDHVLALCYSGAGPHTTTDDAAFDALCAGGLRLNRE